MSVGEDLARAREARGMSVEDVSSATRIRAGLIRAIEADDFGPCGGAVYARGHLRAIARVIGIDPEPLVRDYDRTHDVEDLHVPGAIGATSLRQRAPFKRVDLRVFGMRLTWGFAGCRTESQ